MTTHHYAFCLAYNGVHQDDRPFIMFEKEANALRQLLNLLDTQKDLTFFRMTENPLPYSFAENFIYFRELNEAIWDICKVLELFK